MSELFHKVGLHKPTMEECYVNSSFDLGDGRVGYAAWYPQMGGYTSQAIVEIVGPSGCFDVYVWHDGEFPFDGEGGEQPRLLHHCMAEQFIDFGQVVLRLLSQP